MSSDTTNAVKKEIEYHPIFPGNKYEKPEADALYIPWYFVLGILLMALVVLKKFIYIKDNKKHDQ
jgi:hypothetical protein